MGMRIVRNAEGNCINFIGSSNPAYFNACLSAQINALDSNAVDVINDIRTANDPNTQYEFYSISYTEFLDKDGNAFADAQATVDYINANANVLGISDTGTSLNGINVDFRLDDTSTSIIMDNGSAFGVNTIKAVADADGTIHIHSIGGGVPTGAEDAGTHKHFEGLEVGNVSVDGVSVSGGIQDVTNTLNELFTVGAFSSVVISDPFSTMVADVSGVAATYTLEGTGAVDPVGDDIFSNVGTGNYAGLKSVETIDQAGEYFTFDIRGEGQIGFGLVHTDTSYSDGHYTGNATYANPATFAVSNSAHYGFQFSHWFHPTPNGSWTNYGANTGVIYGSGWYSWESQNEWLAGDPVKIKVGLDENGFIAISSLQDDDTTWILHARSSYPVPEGSEFHLGIKSASSSARVFSIPNVHLLEPSAPTMYFRYVESPDGNFEYPLFATAEEANYYDLNHDGTVGTGTSHTHTYDDDPTNTTWYMPDTGGTMTATVAPSGITFEGNPINYTEITSLSNADLTPTQFSGNNITQEEGTNVNIQVVPAGATWTTSVSISPANSGLLYDGSSLVQGTLADVGADTVYTITVTRANSYGSTMGSITVTATDVAPVQTNTTPWTKALDFSGSNEYAAQVSTSQGVNAISMAGQNNSYVGAGTNAALGYTTDEGAGRPWACATVFSSDGHSSNQHIWNIGDGAGSTDDNIYLRTDQFGALYFGWGREGALNEYRIASSLGTGWYGVYVGYKGARFNSSDANLNNLSDAFTIKLMFSNGTDWIFNPNPTYGGSGTWTTTGGRMDRIINQQFTIGGRGSNRSFHGKVASMVVTTLKLDEAMPNNDEITAMITDPKGWLADYKVGNSYRHYSAGTNLTNFAVGNLSSAFATQVWLMGDGTSDSYANGVRSDVYPSDQNYVKLQLNSMVSNDIQTVNINGLT